MSHGNSGGNNDNNGSYLSSMNMNMRNGQLLTVPEAAKALYLNKSRVRQLLRERKLRGEKRGGRQWLIRKQELDRYMQTPGQRELSPEPIVEPQLHLSLYDYEFGMKTVPTPLGPHRVSDQTCLTVDIVFKSLLELKVESVDLEIGGRRLGAADWEILYVSTGMRIVHPVSFQVPPELKAGNYTARLLAYAAGRWWASESFQLGVPSQ